jgi:hypothetical protein
MSEESPKKRYRTVITLSDGTKISFETRGRSDIRDICFEEIKCMESPPLPAITEGFLTSHRIVLRNPGAKNGSRPTLTVDDGASIYLSSVEFWVLKALAAKMIADGGEPSLSPADKGWITSKLLKGEADNSGSILESSGWTKHDPDTPTRCIHRIRKKLIKSGYSKDLIESKDHAYRISTPPVNIKIDPT